MKAYLILFFTLILSLNLAQAQGDYADSRYDRPAWMDKVYVGGGLGGLGVSNAQFYASINGVVGYRWTERLNTGLGVSYQYTNYKATRFNPVSRSFNDYGFNVFTQYTVIPPVFLMVRYEILFLEQPEGRKNYDAFLVGVGYSQSIGGKGFANVHVLYDVTYDVNASRYDSPWVIGVTFGIDL